MLARGARTVLKELMEVDVGPMDVQKSIDRLQRGVDGVLSRTVMSIEGLLQMYAGRSSTADGVLGRVRRVSRCVVAGGENQMKRLDWTYALTPGCHFPRTAHRQDGAERAGLPHERGRGRVLPLLGKLRASDCLQTEIACTRSIPDIH